MMLTRVMRLGYSGKLGFRIRSIVIFTSIRYARSVWSKWIPAIRYSNGRSGVQDRLGFC